MRKLVWTIMAIGMISAIAPLQAQTYDPNFPVCLQTYGRAGNTINCSYTSLPQCRFSASGRAAQCIVNPYFAGPYRRPRRAYY
jgi:hypothetical protein